VFQRRWHYFAIPYPPIPFAFRSSSSLERSACILPP
jgi:hypothetical protein